jgi:hypothetical protein
MERPMTAEAQHTKWIQKSVEGDLKAFAHLLDQPELVLEAARTSGAEYLLTAAAVRNVLFALQDHTASLSLVQHWASFMRRGYVENAHSGPILPVDIDHEPSADNAITEILSRLDEIGDKVDGDIDSGEVSEMMSRLP